jgi:hypothetical protein
MYDTYTIQKYPRQTVTPLGTNRRKKYLVLFLAFIIAAAAGIAYLVVSSGILSAENPRIPGEVLERINLERQAGSLDPVEPSDSLATEAARISREVRVSPLAYQSGNNPAVSGRTNIVVIPRIAFAIPGYDPYQQVFSPAGSSGNAFRDNALDPSSGFVGIAVSGDSNNYYLVTKWA